MDESDVDDALDADDDGGGSGKQIFGVPLRRWLRRVFGFIVDGMMMKLWSRS